MVGNDSLRRAFQAAAIVSELALWVVVGLWLGSQADRLLATDPWFLFLGVLIGFAGGLFRLFQGIKRLQGDDDDSTGDPP